MNLMIKTVLPLMISEKILCPVMIIVLTAVAAFLISLFASKKFKGSKWKAEVAFAGIATAIAAGLVYLFGCTDITVKGIIFSLILMFCSYSDIKSREVDDYLHVMIVLTAFIGTELSSIPMMLLSSVIISIPTLLVCIICQGKMIGGADIKLTAACVFLLGIMRGWLGFMVGLTLGIIVNLIIQLKNKEVKGFPLVPYLATGFMAAYFI